MKFLNPLKKGFEVVGSVGSVVSDTIETVGEGTNILKAKVNSSVKEEEIEQAKNRILVWHKAVKEISAVTGLTMDEAEEILSNELNK